MFAFELGREFKLSVAEFFALFPKSEIVFFSEKILIISGIEEKDLREKMNNLGGTIKIIKLNGDQKQYGNTNEIYTLLKPFFIEGIKNNYAINFYGNTKINQKDFILKFKKELQKEGFSSRFVNQDFANLNSFKIIKEKLVEKNTDFSIIFEGNKYYFGNTIFIQDIDNYSKRDFGKQRDMETGMLPPKLAQIMINLANETDLIDPEINSGGSKTIYDPFCGLGTVLLESIIAGNKEVYGSDLNPNMVKSTLKNIDFIKGEFQNNLVKYEVLEMDASKIKDSSILKNSKIDAIITEGYLGVIFGKYNVDIEKIENERKKLKLIWEGFFSGLKQLNFSGNMVICFPFWEVNKKYYYFEEIYEIINKYCEINKLLPESLEKYNIRESRSGSLLYKRDNQTVGREIFSLKIKK